MEFKIDKETFSRALQKIQGIVEKRNTMPILSNVLIEAHADRIELTATDLEVGMKSSYETTVTREGRITVSAKKLHEIVKELPEEVISFATKENDWVEIRCGKAQFSIVGLSPEEFPYFPKVNEESLIRIEGALLADMIEKTAYAICFDETKYNLNGTFVKATVEDDRPILRMVATDGHRLSIAEKEFHGAVGPEMAKGVIFPKKGIFELKKICEEATTQELALGFMDNSAVIKKGNTVVVMRLVDGEFPDYTRVVPVANDKIVTVARDPFLHSLRRMSILSSEKFKGIRMEINGAQMVISSSNPELGEASEELEASYSGPPLSIRFNAKYLLDVLAVLSESEVALVLRDELSPAIVKPAAVDGFTAVIMPMRL